mmetsp:Transcript_79372/g.181942  ORF Transcript_79372/g.181942 Transcript_79372/m.181942 type:complete len:222 (-) Transcript_79372:1032-1697(-)
MVAGKRVGPFDEQQLHQLLVTALGCQVQGGLSVGVGISGVRPVTKEHGGDALPVVLTRCHLQRRPPDRILLRSVHIHHQLVNHSLIAVPARHMQGRRTTRPPEPPVSRPRRPKQRLVQRCRRPVGRGNKQIVPSPKTCAAAQEGQVNNFVNNKNNLELDVLAEPPIPDHIEVNEDHAHKGQSNLKLTEQGNLQEQTLCRPNEVHTIHKLQQIGHHQNDPRY